jgi:hypothetical protein
MNPAPMPWMLCRPGFSGSPRLCWVSTGELTGSTATTCTLGLRALSTSPQPVIVPPVPTLETRMSTPPSVSRQISSAVVVRWISGLAGFLNCWGMNALGVVATISSARRTAPGIPSAAGVRTISAPKAFSRRRRSRLMLSGIVTIRR